MISMQVFNKAEIISELNKNVTAFNQYISNLNKNNLNLHLKENGRPAKICSIKPLNTAYGLPGFC